MAATPNFFLAAALAVFTYLTFLSNEASGFSFAPATSGVRPAAVRAAFCRRYPPRTCVSATITPTNPKDGDDGVADEFESYSRCLSPRQEREEVMKEEGRYAIVDRQPLWQKALLKPIKAARRALTGRTRKPGALILLRCGESTWNANQVRNGACNDVLL